MPAFCGSAEAAPMDEMDCAEPTACAACFHSRSGQCALRALLLDHIGAPQAYPPGMALA
ncbi:MAG: hypothetical protein LC624_03680 [Halobacteriales archaeon]|nr:hypothetical protein [Halobacteriales archaeon]